MQNTEKSEYFTFVEDVGFKCNLCYKAFTQPGICSSHYKHVHLGLSFKCETCSATFSQKSNLKIHSLKCGSGAIRTKRRGRPTADYMKEFFLKEDGQGFWCGLCPNKEFANRPGCFRHYTSVHMKIRFECDLCKAKFSQKGNMKLHRKNCSGIGKRSGKGGGRKKKSRKKDRMETPDSEEDLSESEWPAVKSELGEEEIQIFK